MQRNIIGQLNSEALPVFTFCLSLLITVSLLTYVIVPKWLEVQKVKIQLNKYRNLISSENGFAQIKNDIKEKNRLLSEKLDKISNKLSNTQELAGYLELLIEKGKTHDIRFVKMQPQPEIKNQDYTFFPILLEMSTTYNSLGHFISSLEKLPYYFKVERLAIESITSGRIEVKLMVTSIIPTREE
ncbi:MAG TPA: type 4a pilus biogenesis protein PilO [Chitinispirillaceae bacterium]|nr:type 4a pilus biogenesis protein PilO [Chitinispirillaceae bacterium]